MAEAERILAEQRAPAPAARDWHCRHCDEPNEGHFAACWNCGSGADPN
jgi:membrane protease subunit (stomatin/prohibitin family)